MHVRDLPLLLHRVVSADFAGGHAQNAATANNHIDLRVAVHQLAVEGLEPEDLLLLVPLAVRRGHHCRERRRRAGDRMGQ